MKTPDTPDKKRTPRPLAAALFFLACSWARADTFYMKSGNEIEGTALSETSALMTVDTGYGTVNLQKADILKIHRATRAQRQAARKKMLRGKFEAGLLVPKDAEKLDALFRAANSARDTAFDAKTRKEARARELAGLKKNYRDAALELEGIDPQTDPREYNRVVGEINSAAGKIKVKELAEETRQADRPDTSFQSYLDAYNRIEDHLRGGGKAVMDAPRKGRDAEYFAWLRGELNRMKRDFRMDSIESEGKNGHLIVKVLLNGRVSARLMVDTGATMTVLYKNTAAALGLTKKDMAGFAKITLGDGRVIKAPQIVLKSVAVGKSVVKDSAATIMPAGSGQIDGLLGMSFLSHFAMRVDSANGRLILESLK